MRKLLALLLGALLVAASPAYAQMTLMGVGVPKAAGGGGGAYHGPGDDVATWVGYWGVEAYDAAYATALGNGVRLCTAGDAACNIIHFTSAGILNQTEVTSAGCTGTSCTVNRAYDQSGNGHDCINATEALRPIFNNDFYGANKPGITYGAGANANLDCASLPTTAVSWTFIAYFRPSALPGGNGRLFTAADPTGLLLSAAGNFIVNAGSSLNSTSTYTTGTDYAVIGGTDGGGSGCFIAVNGATNAGNCGSGSTGTPGDVNNGGSGAPGAFRMWGYDNSKFSGGDITAVTATLAAF